MAKNNQKTIALIGATAVIIAAIIGSSWIRGCVEGISQEKTVYISNARIVGASGTAYIVSPPMCTPENPCAGEDLVRGVELYVELNKEGFAAAYLQDQHGNFFNQGGKLFIRKHNVGSTKLWPGIPERMDHMDFKLWIVTGDKEIKTSSASTSLEELPSPSNGDKWGPVYLRFRKPGHPQKPTFSAAQAIAIRTDQPPTIDGNIDERVWTRSEPFTFAVHPQANDSTTATVKLLWDEQYLYAGFEVNDTQVEGAADTTTWNGDSISIIIVNNRQIREYRHSLLVDRRGDAESAYRLKGGTTFNDNSDQDKGYFIEIRIPLSPTPVVGQEILADLLSVDHDYNPKGLYDATQTVFSKISWDGDANVDTAGRKIKLIER